MTIIEVSEEIITQVRCTIDDRESRSGSVYLEQLSYLLRYRYFIIEAFVSW
jgi:hypothetical protein